MNKVQKLVLFLGIILIGVFGFTIFRLTREQKGQVTTEQLTSAPLSSPSDSIKSDDIQGSARLTNEEVAKHNSKEDCWTIVSGNVYDISDYISQHPGGNVIVQSCGNDGTALFEKRKTSEGDSIGSGTPHSSQAQLQLEDYLVGPLEKLN